MKPLRLNSVIKEKRLQRTLGRFSSVRRLHGLVSTLHQIASADQDHLDPKDQASSIFGTLDVERMARQIKTDGLALGLKLPEALREGMARFGTRAPVKPWGAKEGLPLETVMDGRLPTGEPVAVAESAGIDGCPEVTRVTRDPKMLLLAKRVLGYNPRNIEVSLRWSFPTGQSIGSAWGMATSQSGPAVTATNLSYNGKLNPGQSAYLGFTGKPGLFANPNPVFFTLNGGSCTG